MIRHVIAMSAKIAAALLLASCGVPPEDAGVPQPNAGHVTADTVLSTYPGPDDRHRLALYGNWDFVDAAAWRAVVTQPDCDRATALAVFWKASPEYYVEYPGRSAVPPVNRVDYDVITLIRERWQAGAYMRAELAFDRETDVWPVDFEALRRRYGGRVDRLMPPDMRVALAGRRLPRSDFPR